MGYNPENYVRITAEFEHKAEAAVNAAKSRTAAAELVIPELKAVNNELSATGFAIMNAIMNNSGDLTERLAEIEKHNDELLLKKQDLLVAAGYPKDFTDVHYECEKCGDTGYADGKMCQCLRTALVIAGYESSGIANLLRSQTFDSFSLDYYKNSPSVYDNMCRVFESVKKYALDFDGKNSGHLAFFGGTGLGKTHLSSAIARTVIEHGYDVMYVTAIGMMSDFEYQRFGSAASPDISPVSRYFDCDLLIIDDLGTEISNQFSVTTLYNVMDTRLKTGKSIIISTNLSQSELRKRYWDRITSRIFGEFRLLLFTGIDVRAQKIKE